MKPKTNKGSNVGKYDNCQTPPYALEPLFPFLKNRNWNIWDCCSGKGTIVKALKKEGLVSFGTDISNGKIYDFFFPGVRMLIPDWHCIITNPPYSIKYNWIEQCYKLKNPFALLMPVETLGAKKAQVLFEYYGIQIIFLRPRVDFYMPDKGYSGGGAQFPTAWFTWKLNLPKEMNYAILNKPKRNELEEYWRRSFNE